MTAVLLPPLVRRFLIACCLLTGAPAPDAVAQAVKVVDVIPLKYSDETLDNSEPTLAVRPGTLTDLAVSAHLRDKRWCKGARPFSGYFVSPSAGDGWTLICLSPNDKVAFDPTLWFSGDGKTLYVSYLKDQSSSGLSLGHLYLQANSDFADPDGLYSILSPNASSKENYDQPQVMGVSGASSRRVVISVAGEKTTSAVEHDQCRIYLFVATQPVSKNDFRWNCVATRMAADNPHAIRIATHPEGRVYVAYLHTRTDTADDFWDVVVQTGKIGSTGKPKLDDLSEPNDHADPCTSGDGLLGVRVARCIRMSETWTPMPDFGWERPSGSELSLAVDPADENHLYVAWGDSTAAGDPYVTLHVRESKDGGKTWPTADLFTVPGATNPALAIDSKGRLGFLYQQIVKSSGAFRWKTRLCITTLCNASSMDATSLLLADTPAGATEPAFVPFIGDYEGLVAVGDGFYGVFSARNDPTDVAFPSGVTYQRRCSGGSLRDEANQAVAPSVDPFFFRVQPDLPPVSPASTKPAC